jgi:hypothetical protein
MSDALILGLLTAFITLLGLLLTWYLHKKKIRSEQRERIHKIFDGFMKLYGGIAHTGKLSRQDIDEFNQATFDSTVLLSRRMNNYRNEIIRKALRFYTLSEIIYNPNRLQGPTEKQYDQYEEISNWFEGQADITKRKFSKYLKL